jgi:adhesin transport system membrane fusion protein|tara:strand:- start:3992 stop:4954 length:963 start_codon:yes stop_codon:yes gene_type:complete
MLDRVFTPIKNFFLAILKITKADLILYVIFLFFILFFIWASVSELEEVTRGQGKVIASSKVQVIQNLEGGIVRNLYVKTGQKVKQGDVLIKLDNTEFLGDLNSAKQQSSSLEDSLSLLREEHQILEPLVTSGVEPRINLIRLLQRISTAQSDYQVIQDQIPNLEDKLLRTSVIAPRDGIINRILINTSGGVVKPGSPILEMIPLDDVLILEVEVAPTDIAYVIKDQKAVVQLSAFDFSVYGSLEGIVLNVSADTITKDDGSTWYICLVSIPADGITTMSRKLDLLPGMQATVNIVSGSKTILQYLIQPFTNIKNKAFRER